MRQPEVHDHRLNRPVAIREHDIPALQVAVDDPRLVHHPQPFADLERNRLYLAPGQRSGLANLVGERYAFKKLHRQECCPSGGIRRRVKGMNAADMGPADSLRQHHFLLEVGQRPGIARDLRTDCLQRDAVA